MPPNDKEEILEAIATFSGQIDQKFDKIDQRLGRVESDIGSIKATMVTKDYLDDKLADLRGDLIGIDRRVDGKIDFLTGHLETAGSLPPASATAVRAIKPLGR